MIDSVSDSVASDREQITNQHFFHMATVRKVRLCDF